jgi:putative transposase
MTSSNGDLINYPNNVTREYYRIRKIQSLLDKKKRKSNNYNKLYKKLCNAYIRLENLKNDFIEKETTSLCKNNSIGVEDLENLMQSNKIIRRQNFICPRKRFVDALMWKCEKFGSYFVVVNPAYTSQKCCICGKIHKLTLKDRIMICDCGNIIDRDINAAINIKNDAIASVGICCTY